MSAVFIAATFAFLHKTVLENWPTAALDGPAMMLAYFTAGVVFQFGIPILCLATLIYGAPARAVWTARTGFACAAVALTAYAVFVAACVEMIR